MSQSKRSKAKRLKALQKDGDKRGFNLGATEFRKKKKKVWQYA